MLLFLNSGENLDSAFEFIGEAGVTTPCLLDSNKSVYDSYDRSEVGASYSPFPLEVVVDRDGIITYLAGVYDAAALREAVDAALAK